MLATPALSVNKLAEFMVKRSARQRQIVYDRKHPDPDFNMGNYHHEVRNAASEYLAGGALDPSIISTAIKDLRQLTPDKVGTARRINSNIDALESFGDMLDEINLDDYDVALGEHAPEKLTFHSVQISVRPEIILRRTVRGKECLGAIKLHFSKTFPHTEESAGYVSAVLQEFLSSCVAKGDEVVHPQSCLVIDTGSGKAYPGVKSTAKRMKDVAAACEHIKALWAVL